MGNKLLERINKRAKELGIVNIKFDLAVPVTSSNIEKICEEIDKLFDKLNSGDYEKLENFGDNNRLQLDLSDYDTPEEMALAIKHFIKI